MIKKSEDTLLRVRASAVQGVNKGWNGYLWLLKIILPISFATTLIVHLGWIYKLDFILTPVTSWLSLPASAAIVLIIGLFTGIYGTVAAIPAFSFTMDQMILIAIFTLISHNLIQESIVQGRSGINPIFAAFFRLFMAFVVTFVCARLLGLSDHEIAAQTGHLSVQDSTSFSSMVLSWGQSTLKLAVQIFCIIMPLMVVLNLAKTFNVIDPITKFCRPLLAVMGLNRSTGMLWLTASIFGLAYGAAVMVEETRNHPYNKEDLTRLHLSVGVNHAMIEDPALFLPLGIPVFWLWIPRLVAAVIAAWIYTAVMFIRRRYVKRAHHKKLCDH
jgi:hypothetical protein